MLNVGKAKPRKTSRILRVVYDVGEDDLTGGLEDAVHLGECSRPLFGVAKVVDCPMRDDGIERLVGERQLAHVGSLILDTLGNALQTGIVERGVRAVVGLVFRLPEVDPDGFAVAKPLGGSDQHQAAPAANVENMLAPAQGNEVEKLFALAELADAAGVKHETSHAK